MWGGVEGLGAPPWGSVLLLLKPLALWSGSNSPGLLITTELCEVVWRVSTRIFLPSELVHLIKFSKMSAPRERRYQPHRGETLLESSGGRRALPLTCWYEVRHEAVRSCDTSPTFHLWDSELKHLSVKVMPCEAQLWYRHTSKAAPTGWRSESLYFPLSVLQSQVSFSLFTRRKAFARISVDARDMLKWVSTPGFSESDSQTHNQSRYSCECVYASEYMHICMWVSICVYMHTCMCTCSRMWMCVHVCLCVRTCEWVGVLNFDIGWLSDCCLHYLNQGLSLDLEVIH